MESPDVPGGTEGPRASVLGPRGQSGSALLFAGCGRSHAVERAGASPSWVSEITWEQPLA